MRKSIRTFDISNPIEIMKLKKDRFSKARGGNSHLLQINCTKCGSYIVTYQKDGIGTLIRMYADRVVEPEQYKNLQFTNNKNGLPNLSCANCKQIIGIPMIYEAENRLAFRLIRGSFVKKKSF